GASRVEGGGGVGACPRARAGVEVRGETRRGHRRRGGRRRLDDGQRPIALEHPEQARTIRATAVVASDSAEVERRQRQRDARLVPRPVPRGPRRVTGEEERATVEAQE